MNEPEVSVTHVRTISAPVQKVFAAWTDPKRLARWMAPLPYEVQVAEADVREGGCYRIETRGPDGVLHLNTGEYREIVPNRRIVKTWIYDGPKIAARDVVTMLTVEFRELGPNTTELTLKHERLPDAEYGASVRQGWGGCLDRLEVFCRSASGPFGQFPGDQTARIERVVPGPLERVWKHLVQPDHLASWLAKAEIEPRLGGRVKLDMTANDPNPAQVIIIHGRITVYEPPVALAYTWKNDPPLEGVAESEIRFDLTPDGENVRLVLTHTRVTREWLAEAAAGWHAHLDHFQASLQGRAPAPIMTIFEEVYPGYQRLAAGR